MTIVELLIASVIAIWVATLGVALYFISQRTWQESAATLELQRNANLGMERILRGFKSSSDPAPHGLLDAEAFVIDGPQTIRFTSGIDSRQRSFYQSGAYLMYDPDTSVASNEIQILDNVSGLAFLASAINPAKLVAITLSLTKQVRGVDRTLTLSGAALIRNG